MTKKEIHKIINEAFYNFVKENYPQYEASGECEGGRMTLIYIGHEKKREYRDMEYHVSQHYVSSYDYNLNKEIEDKMNLFLEDQMRKYNI